MTASPIPDPEIDQPEDRALANLRHAYRQLLEGVVVDQAAFAKGLIGPAISALERAQTVRASRMIAGQEVVSSPGAALAVKRLILTPEGKAALQVQRKTESGKSA